MTRARDGRVLALGLTRCHADNDHDDGGDESRFIPDVISVDDHSWGRHRFQTGLCFFFFPFLFIFDHFSFRASFALLPFSSLFLLPSIYIYIYLSIVHFQRPPSRKRWTWYRRRLRAPWARFASTRRDLNPCRLVSHWIRGVTTPRVKRSIWLLWCFKISGPPRRCDVTVSYRGGNNKTRTTKIAAAAAQYTRKQHS